MNSCPDGKPIAGLHVWGNVHPDIFMFPTGQQVYTHNVSFVYSTSPAQTGWIMLQMWAGGWVWLGGWECVFGWVLTVVYYYGDLSKYINYSLHHISYFKKI